MLTARPRRRDTGADTPIVPIRDGRFGRLADFGCGLWPVTTGMNCRADAKRGDHMIRGAPDTRDLIDRSIIGLLSIHRPRWL
jgi:hypothetical protein